MEIIAVSSPGEVANEVEEAIKMLDQGLRHFHIRKPRMSHRQMAAYIKTFPEAYRKQLVIHSYHGLAQQLNLGGIHLSRHHRKRNWLYNLRLWLRRKAHPELVVTRSFHKLTDLNSDKRTYTYSFLSPVFDGVSQHSLGGGYSRRALLIMIPQARQPVYAMGGVQPGNIKEIAELGFQGAALLGSLWKSSSRPHEIFLQAQENARKITLTGAPPI